MDWELNLELRAAGWSQFGGVRVGVLGGFGLEFHVWKRGLVASRSLGRARQSGSHQMSACNEADLAGPGIGRATLCACTVPVRLEKLPGISGRTRRGRVGAVDASVGSSHTHAGERDTDTDRGDKIPLERTWSSRNLGVLYMLSHHLPSFVPAGSNVHICITCIA